jgi:hypothetical protein
MNGVSGSRGMLSNPQMQPTGRAGPRLLAAPAFLVAKQRKR